jgi:hypothetical protein
MSKRSKQKLTLYQPETYQIKVPGELGASWSDWGEGMAVAVENDKDGLPLISVECVEDEGDG